MDGQQGQNGEKRRGSSTFFFFPSLTMRNVTSQGKRGDLMRMLRE